MNKLCHIRNFLRVDDRLATSGMPQPDDFLTLRQEGFEVVINLALPTSENAMPNEGDLVSAQGMTYVHIPVNFESPLRTDFERFTKIMDVCADQKIFVHCAANMRVSAFVSCIACGTAWIAQRLRVISRKSGNQTACGGIL